MASSSKDKNPTDNKIPNDKVTLDKTLPTIEKTIEKGSAEKETPPPTPINNNNNIPLADVPGGKNETTPEKPPVTDPAKSSKKEKASNKDLKHSSKDAKQSNKDAKPEKKLNLKDLIKKHLTMGACKMDYGVDELHQLLDLAKVSMQKMSTLVELSAPVNVCG